MSTELPQELRKAARYIAQGDLSSARTLLANFLKHTPSSDDGWLLLSLSLEDPDKQILCLERALSLNPENQRAQQRLNSLRSSSPPAVTQPETAEDSPIQTHDEISNAEGWPPPPITDTGGLSGSSSEMEDAEPVIASGGIYANKNSETAQGASNGPSTEAPHAGTARSARRRQRPWILWLMGIVVGVIFIGTALYVGLNVWGNYQASQAIQRTQVAEALATGGAELPPSWTPEPTATTILTKTPTPTATITPTPTLSGPTEREFEEINTIRVEVSDLRGLPGEYENPIFIVTKRQVRPVLENLYTSSGGTEQQVEDQKRQLVALGLIKPTYNLFDNILNNIADGIGGFFDPATDEIYVIGTRFGGIEHFIFSHEYDHALVYQNFALEQAGIDPVCLDNEDACRAFTALVEGDATVLMLQWWVQYASPEDYRDILTYQPAWYTLPEQFPPPFAELDANFPYDYGQIFVEYLFDRGNWAEVNKAYDDPPVSTEQILHPAKYLSRERPVNLVQPALESALGAGWRLLVDDTLGEWTTFLILGYGADNVAQLDDQTAARAAAGWGGDSYQVYYHQDLDQTLLAAEWIWDTDADQIQFYQAMVEYQDQRFRGAQRDYPGGDCWVVNDQISCLFRDGRRTFWLMAPDEATLTDVLQAYSRYP